MIDVFICQSGPDSYWGHLNPLNSGRKQRIEEISISPNIWCLQPHMSSSFSDDSTGSSQSVNSSVRSHKGTSPVDTTIQTVSDSSSRTGVKSKVVRLHKAEEKCRLTTPLLQMSPGTSHPSQAAMLKTWIGHIRVVAWLTLRPRDPSSRHWDDFAPGSSQPPPGNKSTPLSHLAPGKISPARQRLGRPSFNT